MKAHSIFAAVAFAVCSPAGAQSVPASPEVPSSVGAVSHKAVETPQQVRDYWTPERMREAKPMEVHPASPASPQPAPARPAQPERPNAEPAPGAPSK